MLLPNFYLFWPCFLTFLSHWNPQFLFRSLRPPAVLAAAGVAPFGHGGLCPAITDSKGKKYRKPVVKIHRFSSFFFFFPSNTGVSWGFMGFLASKSVSLSKWCFATSAPEILGIEPMLNLLQGSSGYRQGKLLKLSFKAVQLVSYFLKILA